MNKIKEEFEKKIIDAFLTWYSTAWANEELSEKDGVGLRDKFCGDFLRELDIRNIFPK